MGGSLRGREGEFKARGRLKGARNYAHIVPGDASNGFRSGVLILR